MTDLDLDAIEARANAATDGPWLGYDERSDLREENPDVNPMWVVAHMEPDGVNWVRDIADIGGGEQDEADAEFIAHARTDVPALVAALREARAEVERLTCRHSLSSDGDEGPVVNLPGLFVVRWHCNECDGKWYDDNALAHLRDTIRSQTDSLNAAEAEVERLRTQHAADLDRVTLLRAGAVVAERDDWRRRYEALRDGVTGLCDGWESGANDYDGGPLVNAEAFASDLRAVVARVEES